MSWNEFLSACAEAWGTQGVSCSNKGKEAHYYLINCEKRFGDSLITVASSAYKLMRDHQE